MSKCGGPKHTEGKEDHTSYKTALTVIEKIREGEEME